VVLPIASRNKETQAVERQDVETNENLVPIGDELSKIVRAALSNAACIQGKYVRSTDTISDTYIKQYVSL